MKFLGETYIKVYVLRIIFMIFWIIFLIFFHFFADFSKKNPVFLKSMTKIAPFPQPNFAIWFRFWAIFHQPWTPWPWWKIPKSVLVCSRWPVETVLSKFSKNLPLGNFMFLLNIIVVFHWNASQMNRNNQIKVRTHFLCLKPKFSAIIFQFWYVFGRRG